MPYDTAFLKDLNDPQKEAVLHGQGPLLVLAGAGSGKTRVLIYRVAHLISRGMAPWNILAVTFTNKAAKEMKYRVERMLGPAAGKVWVATFHSTAAQILRSRIHLLGYSRDFTIYDEDDSLKAIKAVMKELDIDPKAISPKWMRSKIDSAKRNRMKFSEQIEYESGVMRNVPRIALAYEEKLKAANALDFNDLLLYNLLLFEKFPEVLKEYQERFRYILVDEYQDTNEVQYLIVKNLASGHGNICVVGDEDQSIYGWRGANMENILNFANDFPGARLIKLEQNYRSKRNIIEAASAVISNNTRRTPKKLWTENEDGQKIQLREANDERAEARHVVEQVLRLKSKGYSLRDMAVLYRTHAQSRSIEDEVRSVNMPYSVYGGVRFYDRKEIKDIIAYLRVLVNPSDEVSMLRIINEPPRGIGPGTVQKLKQIAEENNITLSEALYMAAQKSGLPKRVGEKVAAFQAFIETARKKAETGDSLVKLVESVLKKSGYEDSLIEEATMEAQTRLENLDELMNAVSEYEKTEENPTLSDFLEKVALYSDIDEYDSEQGSLSLMTLHNAKGLEFPVVFMVGMEEGLFPHERSLEEEEYGEDIGPVEEERRLCYVGMTRAKEILYLSYARTRSIRGSRISNEPSRFIFETPEKFLEAPLRLRTWTGLIDKDGTGMLDARETEYDESPGMDYGFSDDEQEYWDPEAEVTFRKGMKVRHPDFGTGKIQKIEGHGDRIKLTIKFKKGTKKILAGYGGLEPAE